MSATKKAAVEKTSGKCTAKKVSIKGKAKPAVKKVNKSR